MDAPLVPIVRVAVSVSGPCDGVSPHSAARYTEVHDANGSVAEVPFTMLIVVGFCQTKCPATTSGPSMLYEMVCSPGTSARSMLTNVLIWPLGTVTVLFVKVMPVALNASVMSPKTGAASRTIGRSFLGWPTIRSPPQFIGAAGTTDGVTATAL